MHLEDKVEMLRKRLSEQRKKLEKATIEKGLAAEENKDLRENFAYDYWVDQERLITARIHATLKEIESLTKRPKIKKHPTKKKSENIDKIKDLPKNKWL